jgi:hypothetical protein
VEHLPHENGVRESEVCVSVCVCVKVCGRERESCAVYLLVVHSFEVASLSHSPEFFVLRFLFSLPVEKFSGEKKALTFFRRRSEWLPELRFFILKT